MDLAMSFANTAAFAAEARAVGSVIEAAGFVSAAKHLRFEFPDPAVAAAESTSGAPND